MHKDSTEDMIRYNLVGAYSNTPLPYFVAKNRDAFNTSLHV